MKCSLSPKKASSVSTPFPLYSSCSFRCESDRHLHPCTQPHRPTHSPTPPIPRPSPSSSPARGQPPLKGNWAISGPRGYSSRQNRGINMQRLLSVVWAGLPLPVVSGVHTAMHSPPSYTHTPASHAHHFSMSFTPSHFLNSHPPILVCLFAVPLFFWPIIFSGLSIFKGKRSAALRLCCPLCCADSLH